METNKAAYKSVVIPPNGFVNLSDKSTPVFERQSDYDEYYAFTRATVDIQPFKTYLQSLPQTVWEDKCQDGNVQLIRPAHDKWGIKKIIFTFCDDFLQKIYDLPWSQLEIWRKYLLPIYQSVEINENQVVRSLLASIPPGVSIPVHHDTGYWVKKTHRLHVAVVTNDEVDFLAGPTCDDMKKYVLNEGRVIELNNQAKHAVYNNSSTLWRVHFIFDYVELDFSLPRRVTLNPGEKVNQTRRSIDLAREQGKRKIPSFIIIGAQKCGTTSLYEYICNHPLVLPGGRRETHFFDWRWNNALTTSDAQIEYYMRFYDKNTIDKNPSLMTGESTPSYLLHSDIVIPRIISVCPWTKIFIILRNPVERAYSQYQMCIDTAGTPEQLKVRGMSSYMGKSFEQIIQEEMALLKAVNITPESSYEDFKSRVLTELPLTHGGHSILVRGMYSLQLQPWLNIRRCHGLQKSSYNRDEGTKSLPNMENAGPRPTNDEKYDEMSPDNILKLDIKILSLTQLKGSLVEIQRTMDDVYNFVGLPPHDLEQSEIMPKNTRNYKPMSEESRAMLEEFYEPYNKRLKEMLEKLNIDISI